MEAGKWLLQAPPLRSCPRRPGSPLGGDRGEKLRGAGSLELGGQGRGERRVAPRPKPSGGFLSLGGSPAPPPPPPRPRASLQAPSVERRPGWGPGPRSLASAPVGSAGSEGSLPRRAWLPEVGDARMVSQPQTRGRA